MDARDDVEVNDTLVIPAAELTWRFSPSGGPGGQHANTSNTRAEVVFDIAASAVLTDAQRRRLLGRFGPRLSISVDDTRSQTRNRQLARERLAARLAEALRPAKPRRATKPSRGAKERRLQEKRRRSQLKANRRRRDGDD
ncbi:MAG: alternative ribosome rescue aminoacyl-tRNA hydrolase ArfB [Acidimicrobiia bacterium]|nr:alternative ribosome rescue aminoacyl-tRNA hydrolase ArfB [Acidimicrobiia bacterium]